MVRSSVKQLFIALVFGEKRENVVRLYAHAIKRLAKMVYGRKIVGLVIFPEKSRVVEDWISVDAKADRIHGDTDVLLDIEIRFDTSMNKLVTNLIFKETGEIRQKQLSPEEILRR